VQETEETWWYGGPLLLETAQEAEKPVHGSLGEHGGQEIGNLRSPASVDVVDGGEDCCSDDDGDGGGDVEQGARVKEKFMCLPPTHTSIIVMMAMAMAMAMAAAAGDGGGDDVSRSMSLPASRSMSLPASRSMSLPASRSMSLPASRTRR
jgi:hypothetical protein